MLIQGKLLSYGDDLSQVFKIRRKVFVEEQGLSENTVFDENDFAAIHAIVYQGTDYKTPVAAGRIVYDGDICILDYIAVLEDYRGCQYGDFTVRLLLNKAFTSGVKKVFLNANLFTVEFYKKIGFVTESNEFSMEGTRLVKMSIRPENMLTKCKK